MKIERAVVDTNVLISAALSPRSAPAQIVDCLLQHATLVFSQETFQELETRLWRPKFDHYLDIDRRRLLLRSEEHTSELQSLMRISYAVFCLKKNKKDKLSTTVSIISIYTPLS